MRPPVRPIPSRSAAASTSAPGKAWVRPATRPGTGRPCRATTRAVTVLAPATLTCWPTIARMPVSYGSHVPGTRRPGAEATLNAGCPQDLSLTAFPAGACSRTVLGKIEIVLLRVAEDAFRVECWRSFSDYAYAFLSDAA